MSELKVHVERVVRPVRAGAARKLKMREELLAHLTAVYDEERAALGDDALALQSAVRRFGDPAALTAELQATVPAAERVLTTPVWGPAWERRFAYWFREQPGEGALRHAVRLSATLAAFVLVMVALIPALRWAKGVPWEQVRVDPVAAAAVTVHAFVSTLMLIGFFRALGGALTRGAVARAVACGVVLSAGGPLLLSTLHTLQPDNLLWLELTGANSPGRVILTGVFWLAASAVVVRFVFVRARRSAEWTRLEVG